jgi:ABC-2 type transport system permease protein
VPLVISGLLVISAALTNMGSGNYGRMPFGQFNLSQAPDGLAAARTVGIAMYSIRQWMLAVPLGLAVTVMLYFYLLSSLFDERKDRSVLFWKSLPVSDAATVASKLLVALVIVPLGVFAVALVTNLLYTAVWDARIALGLVRGPAFIWDPVAWLKVEGLLLSLVIVSMLWYAPVAAYLLLISAWSRRNVFLWAILPPLILWIVEKVAFGTTYFIRAFMYRLGGIWGTLGLNHTLSDAFVGSMVNTGRGKLVYLPAVFDALPVRDLFANIGLWTGLAVAGALTYLAVRILRLSDDT